MNKFKSYRGEAHCDTCQHSWITKKLKFNKGSSKWSPPSNCPLCHSRKTRWLKVWGLVQ